MYQSAARRACAPGYLPKFSSSFAQELLNDQASDFSLARRILADYHPLQPEMIMQLAAQQHPQFLCPSVLRKFVVPVPWEKPPQLIVQAYTSSGWRRESMSLLEFLRKAGRDGQISQRYRRLHRSSKVAANLEEWINSYSADGQTLVACVMYSHINDRYFGQWLLLHVPFRSVDNLWDERAAQVPEGLRFLTLCLLRRPDFWRNPDRIRQELEREARTEVYIKNTLAMIAARTELADAYLAGEMTLAETPNPALHGTTPAPGGAVQLAPEQDRVVRSIAECVEGALRAKWPEDGDEDAWGIWLDSAQFQNKVYAVLGPAGRR